MIKAKVKEWLKKLTQSAGRCDLLWTNTSAGSFSARTIPLDLSRYDYVRVEFYSQADSDPTTAPLEIIVGSTNSVVLFHALTTAQVNQNVGTRNIRVTDTGVTFGDYSYKNWASGTTRTTYNTACVPYKIYGIKYGGVLRNLSIFKAFRHFMSLQKGGGIDGQTGYKGITLQGSRKADQHRNGIHRKLDRVVIFCEQRTSDADTHSAGGNVHIADSYAADEHCVILSELQYKSSAIQGGGRSRLVSHSGDSHRASRRIPAKFGINTSDVFILGKGFNNRYPNCITLSERGCVA